MALFIPVDQPIVNPLTGAIDFGWLKLFDSLANGSGNIPWGNINFAGSSLADIITRSASSLNAGTVPLARLSGITTAQLSASAGIVVTQLGFTGTLDASHFLTGAGTIAAITKAVYSTHSFATIAAGSTVYMGFAGTSATETQMRFVCPVTGTLRNLFVSADAAPGAAQTFAYTVRKNAADTSLTCTTSGAASTSSSDVVNSASVTAGDLVTVKLITSAGAAVQRHTAGFEVATA